MAAIEDAEEAIPGAGRDCVRRLCLAKSSAHNLTVPYGQAISCSFIERRSGLFGRNEYELLVNAYNGTSESLLSATRKRKLKPEFEIFFSSGDFDSPSGHSRGVCAVIR